MSVGEAATARASVDDSVYFALDTERGQNRRRRSIFALYSVVTSRFTYRATEGVEYGEERVEYGRYIGFAPILYRNSLDNAFRVGKVIMNATTYSVDMGCATDEEAEQVEDVASRVAELIEKANNGSSRTKWSFSDNIPVLVDLTSESKMNEILKIFGYESDDDVEDEDE